MRRPPSPIMVMMLLLLAALAAPSVVVAQAPPHPAGGPPMPGAPGGPPPPDAMLVPMLLQSANLTPEQEARVRAIVAARQAAMRALLDQLRRAEDDLADQLFATGASTDVSAAVARVSQLRDQLLQESARAALDVRRVLTADQLARAMYVKDRMRALQAEMRQLTQPMGRRSP